MRVGHVVIERYFGEKATAQVKQIDLDTFKPVPFQETKKADVYQKVFVTKHEALMYAKEVRAVSPKRAKPIDEDGLEQVVDFGEVTK